MQTDETDETDEADETDETDETDEADETDENWSKIVTSSSRTEKHLQINFFEDYSSPIFIINQKSKLNIL